MNVHRYAIFVLATAALAQEVQPREVKSTASPGAPPSDAVVLFDGTDASEWVHQNGRPAEWPIEGGALVCRSGSGDLYSKRKLGSAQIHLEFSTPDMPQATFKELWQTVEQGKVWHGHVKNLRRDGRHYWVYATVIPNVRQGRIVGYTSVRRQPSRNKVHETEQLHKTLRSAPPA